MQRFSAMMLDGLKAAGVAAELILPEPVFGKFRYTGSFIAKWLAYVDKFILFPQQLRRKLKAAPAVVHVCDHSNAMYTQHVHDTPVVVTCHDLLAVRGALGEPTDTPASSTGKFLQRWILRGLRGATAVPCDSLATLHDAEQLVSRGAERPTLRVITLGLSFPYAKLTDEEVQRRLAAVPALLTAPFALNVGSNLRRKNREAVLRIFSQCATSWGGQLVFAGEPLSDSLRAQADALHITDRIVEVRSPDNQLLEAIYNRATALLFPSRFEGFGWPIAEAQACGCPVICSSTPPMNEVGGDGALLRDPEDEAGFAADLTRLTDDAEHARWRARALESAKRFAAPRMIAEYCELYRSLGAAC